MPNPVLGPDVDWQGDPDREQLTVWLDVDDVGMELHVWCPTDMQPWYDETERRPWLPRRRVEPGDRGWDLEGITYEILRYREHDGVAYRAAIPWSWAPLTRGQVEVIESAVRNACRRYVLAWQERRLLPYGGESDHDVPDFSTLPDEVTS